MIKKNKEASKALRRIYNNLARSVDATIDLQLLLEEQKDKRASKAKRAANLLIKCQQILNPLAEDDDIRLL